MKKIQTAITIFIAATVLFGGLFFAANWIPGKYAIGEKDFADYKPYILVREVHYTGTGWVQTGDENGGFKPEEYVDVDIDNGNILPQMEMYDWEHTNTFLCKVEYKGKIRHEAFEGEIDSYHVVEWYPVYPVRRDTILPEWLYPKAFLTKRECTA